jgi:hypothetical protein
VSIVVADVAWWGPLAIAGGAVAGLATGFLLLAIVAGPRSSGSQISDRVSFERTEKTNYPRLNPAAFVVVFAIVALIVGLAVGLSVD